MTRPRRDLPNPGSAGIRVFLSVGCIPDDSERVFMFLSFSVARQGSYDRAMAWKESSVRDVGEEIATCLAKGDSSSAIRLAFHFLERYDKSDWETRARITADAPITTGSDRYDALLAGIVEFACASHGVVAPSWVNDEHYFLNKWWFVSGMASLHANALVHSPISLARRGVFVTQGALEYA